MKVTVHIPEDYPQDTSLTVEDVSKEFVSKLAADLLKLDQPKDEQQPIPFADLPQAISWLSGLVKTEPNYTFPNSPGENNITLNKLNFIKLIRSLYHCGLKEAKDIADQII